MSPAELAGGVTYCSTLAVALVIVVVEVPLTVLFMLGCIAAWAGILYLFTRGA